MHRPRARIACVPDTDGARNGRRHSRIVSRGASRHQYLADDRNAGERDLAQNLFAGGHDSPREHVELLRGQRLLQGLLAGARFIRKKDDAYCQWLPGVERKPGGGEQKIPRDGGHDTHTVAAFAVGGDSSAMRQTSQGGKGLGQNFMGGNIAQRGHETDPAGVVVKARIQKGWGTAMLQRLRGKETHT